MSSVVVMSKDLKAVDAAFAKIGMDSGGILSIPLSNGWFGARLDLDADQIATIQTELEKTAWIDQSDKLDNGQHLAAAIAQRGLYRIGE